MKLLVATRSSGKQRELRRLFEGSGWDVVFPEGVGIAPSAEEDLLEGDSSFQVNATRKAEYFAKKTRLPTLADDSGLEVFALGGAPGTLSKRWSGFEGPPDAVDQANNRELLRRLAGAPEQKRRARYVCALVYLPDPNAAPVVFEETTTGRILESPEGTGGFGYDPLFWSDDLGKSFGSATAEEKDGVSHRGRAFRGFLEAIRV